MNYLTTTLWSDFTLTLYFFDKLKRGQWRIRSKARTAVLSHISRPTFLAHLYILFVWQSLWVCTLWLYEEVSSLPVYNESDIWFPKEL